MEKPIFPQDVALEADAIVIMWDDGHRSPFPHRFLRLRCQCASCVDEMSGNPRLDPDKVPQDVRAVDHLPVGNYAVQFLWTDGHFTGIYPYEIVRKLCPCALFSAKS